MIMGVECQAFLCHFEGKTINSSLKSLFSQEVKRLTKPHIQCEVSAEVNISSLSWGEAGSQLIRFAHCNLLLHKKPPESREASSVKWIPPDILVVVKFYHPILSETCNLILIPIYDRIKLENRIPQEKSSII